MTELLPGLNLTKLNELLVAARLKVHARRCELALLRSEGEPGYDKAVDHYNCSSALEEMRMLAAEYRNLKVDVENLKSVQALEEGEIAELASLLKDLEIAYEQG